MYVDKGVLDVLVSEGFHDMKDVFGSVVFHCAFPVAECFEGYSCDAWVFQFVGKAFSLLGESVAVVVEWHVGC